MVDKAHRTGFGTAQQLSDEKNSVCLGYIGEYITQLSGDFNKPI